MELHNRKHRISLLVPFRTDFSERQEVWHWLKKYWKKELPNVEIVVGHDHGGKPFSKTAAINDAAKRATGDIFVVLDADTYLPGEVILHCAGRIRNARERGVPMWFVPYRHIYRLTKAASRKILDSDPSNPIREDSPPNPDDVEDTAGSLFGHKYGALIMIMPREAFETVGCMDPRFRGWGGEDVSFLRAIDTLYTRHKNTPNDVFHIYHFRKGANYEDRMWHGQDHPRMNERLANRYNKATHKPIMMRKLVDEGCNEKPEVSKPGGWLKKAFWVIVNWFVSLWNFFSS